MEEFVEGQQETQVNSFTTSYGKTEKTLGKGQLLSAALHYSLFRAAIPDGLSVSIVGANPTPVFSCDKPPSHPLGESFSLNSS